MESVEKGHITKLNRSLARYLNEWIKTEEPKMPKKMSHSDFRHYHRTLRSSFSLNKTFPPFQS